MFISLVGMSGSGKSWWGRKLRDELGFKLICCDEIIATSLAHELPSGYAKQTEALAHWLGTPFDARYQERRNIYLQHEENSLRYALDQIREAMQITDLAHRPNLVIDTTGSVIYLSPAILSELQNTSLIVYLSLANQETETLFRRYSRRPKPIIWHDGFSIDRKLSRQELLYRNYTQLVTERQEKYDHLAKIRVSLEECNADIMKATEFIQKITD